jgi:hypothetical protein
MVPMVWQYLRGGLVAVVPWDGRLLSSDGPAWCVQAERPAGSSCPPALARRSGAACVPPRLESLLPALSSDPALEALVQVSRGEMPCVCAPRALPALMPGCAIGEVLRFRRGPIRTAPLLLDA